MLLAGIRSFVGSSSGSSSSSLHLNLAQHKHMHHQGTIPARCYPSHPVPALDKSLGHQSPEVLITDDSFQLWVPILSFS